MDGSTVTLTNKRPEPNSCAFGGKTSFKPVAQSTLIDRSWKCMNNAYSPPRSIFSVVPIRLMADNVLDAAFTAYDFINSYGAQQLVLVNGGLTVTALLTCANSASTPTTRHAAVSAPPDAPRNLHRLVHSACSCCMYFANPATTHGCYVL